MKRIRVLGKTNRETRAFLTWLETATEIRHDLTFEPVHDCIEGVAILPGTPGPLPYFLVRVYRDLLRTLDSYAHEFCHYEQWRDKRPMNDRGVPQRAAALVRAWKRTCDLKGG